MEDGTFFVAFSALTMKLIHVGVHGSLVLVHVATRDVFCVSGMLMQLFTIWFLCSVHQFLGCTGVWICTMTNVT